MRKFLLTSLMAMAMSFGMSLHAAYITDKLVAGLYKENKVSDKPLKALSSGTPLEVIERKKDFIKVRTSDGTIGWVEATYLTDEKPAKSMLLDTQAKMSSLQKQLNQLKTLQEKGASSDAIKDLADLQDKLAKSQGQISQLELQLQAAKLNVKNLEEEKELFAREKQKLLDDAKAGVRDEMAQLEQKNKALTDQIEQVANILEISTQPTQVPSTATQDISAQQSPANESIMKPLVNAFSHSLLWVLAVVSLIGGIALGYFYMRYKVQQRFGSVLRL